MNLYMIPTVSPGIGDNNAWYILINGDSYPSTVVRDSYGSPGTDNSSRAWNVTPDGEAYLYNGVYNSYGKYFIRSYIIRVDKYNLAFI